MSRETDSSSSGPQGRGGAAYPSGTPPYGSRQYPSLHPEQDAPDETSTAPAPPDEPKTETTLTTRIRINIPGSRPIPPVVMRTPMSDVDAGPPGAGGPAGPPAPAGRGDDTGGVPRPGTGPDGAADEAPPAGEKKPPASDWFAPRKAGAPGGMGAGAAVTAQSPKAPGPGAGGGAPGGRTDLPYGGAGGPDTRGGAGVPRPPAPGGNAFMPPGSGGTPAYGTSAPDGPTTGPASGTSSLAFLDLPPGADLGASGGPAGPAGAGAGGPARRNARDDRDERGGRPRMSDDTAILTPQTPAPEPPGGLTAHLAGEAATTGIPVVPPDSRSPFPPGDMSGGRFQDGQLPPPPGASTGLSSRAGGPDLASPDFPGPPGPASGGPGSAPAPARSASPPPKKKGRSKLMAAGVGVVFLVAVAYGAGLLMNHSDVPKGTTVLGVDIGGGTRDDAVNKLEATLGKRSTAPLQLSVGGKKRELGPDKAGLSLDSQATVRNAAGSDYNPVSVIGSLFGGERVTEPVIPVDEEKLRVALTDLAGDSGSAAEGTITFEPGQAVAVPGKTGTALDVERSMISVRDAYRAQVETGKPNGVELPISSREPTIGQAELDRAMKEFAEPAMSGLITIRAGGREIQFGPDRSLPQILSMKAVDGKLVEVYDRAAIEKLLDGVFEGLTITRADGKEHPLNATDVAQAMQQPLLGTNAEERTAEIDLNPQG
ncbi:hypothetical protein OG875_09445 [Streptomyces sp. NBC_01498]|uniref:hypothetical protein n=1 Tax=Streptomyces sp. NBC_01498 TaxID=2975870 RepID=UPI002E7C3A56|nr:hypothetical protein [Streptomyces sp. NBC_01498]WTL24801.1 hypothetical protein OG875_09445 [Streptomyces sp. NBC_01498]